MGDDRADGGINAGPAAARRRIPRLSDSDTDTNGGEVFYYTRERIPVAPTRSVSRRRFLIGSASGGAIAAFAGCTDGDSDPEPESETDTRSEDEDTDDGPESGNEGSNDGLDLREANVVDVSFEGQDGSYTFDVSLHHDDDGEDGYANWWQVERPDGTRFGRRDLAHPHSQQPFTRSGTIEIPDDVRCVVVRGLDQTHGYGGLAVAVDLASGTTRTVDQGSERQSFGPGICPA
jgi:hypothetical protein